MININNNLNIKNINNILNKFQFNKMNFEYYILLCKVIKKF